MHVFLFDSKSLKLKRETIFDGKKIHVKRFSGQMHALCQKRHVKCSVTVKRLWFWLQSYMLHSSCVQSGFTCMSLAGLSDVSALVHVYICINGVIVSLRRAAGHRHAAAGEEQLWRRRSEELLQCHACSGSAAHLWPVHQQTHAGPAGRQIHLWSTSGLLWFIELVP